ncbi:DEAD/DEAH box helicase [Rothia sp. (in: high G+C Gram-positive bacteria)]|uniref:DEAD/DEAH box helicase n=1 Tax=Rothia sp. (in: high G+C Gram-positive bacteria) TaxID=1885016 RepID=UPI001CB500B3|nr:DEAD/DEAH box helicase [Rothia sp. (in: high G+C Gram-positive bacteria)]MBF1655974.1 DEAD/DEAH box helicase [Rothia sp. (in: high G+C Gram-positive bacteria)]
MTETNTQETTQTAKSFADFGVRQDISDALAAVGITSPFPIQELTLPVALSGQDIIGQAKTGTGKTLGFGLPTIQRVVGRDDEGWADLEYPGAPQALILVPTRELAIQVGEDLAIAAKLRNARVATLYGGVPIEPQAELLRRGLEVAVGTPGRIIDLYQQGFLNLKQVKIVVLDEADEMLDLGFQPSVEKILSYLPEDRQSMLFSATMPGPVIAMARQYMTKPMRISAADPEDASKTKASIRQVVYRAHHLDKDEMIGRILRATGRGRTVIFTKTKRDAARVAEELVNRGFAAAPLHGDLNQVAREQALKAFRTGKVDILVATDVAARGIDVEDVTHVINHRVPEDEKTYLHRTGRTGRAGNEGTAITLVDWDDLPRWKVINDALELGVPEPVETYSSSEHLFYDLNIPAGTKGRLPREERVAEGMGDEFFESARDSRDGRPARSRGGRDGGREGGRSGEKGSRRSRGGREGRSSEGRGERRSRSEGRKRTERSERSSERAERTEQGASERSERAPRQRRRTRRVEGQPVEGEGRRRTRRRSEGSRAEGSLGKGRGADRAGSEG